MYEVLPSCFYRSWRSARAIFPWLARPRPALFQRRAPAEGNSEHSAGAPGPARAGISRRWSQGSHQRVAVLRSTSSYHSDWSNRFLSARCWLTTIVTCTDEIIVSPPTEPTSTVKSPSPASIRQWGDCFTYMFVVGSTDGAINPYQTMHFRPFSYSEQLRSWTAVHFIDGM